MKRNKEIVLSKRLQALLLLLLFIPFFTGNSAGTSAEGLPMEGVRAVQLMAEGFNWGEAFFLSDWLERYGCEVTFAGLEEEVTCEGGTEPTEMDVLISDVNITDYDCVCIPGGDSPFVLVEDQETLNLVKAAYNAGLVLAAICSGPLVLAKAGVIAGRNVTGEAHVKAELEAAGGIYQYAPVVVDGPIVTANYPYSKEEFIGITQALGYAEENPPTLVNTTVEPASGELGTAFRITVELSDEFSVDYASAHIYLVNASERTFVRELVLGYESEEGIYNKNLPSLTVGDYSVDVIAEDLFGNRETYENATTLSVVDTTSTTTPAGTLSWLVPIFALSIIMIISRRIFPKRE